MPLPPPMPVFAPAWRKSSRAWSPSARSTRRGTGWHRCAEAGWPQPYRFSRCWEADGASTILASGIDPKYFTPINKVEDRTIQVKGKINEVIPKRGEQLYTKTLVDSDQSMLTIAEPAAFWQDNYLVIITD